MNMLGDSEWRGMCSRAGNTLVLLYEVHVRRIGERVGKDLKASEERRQDVKVSFP